MSLIIQKMNLKSTDIRKVADINMQHIKVNQRVNVIDINDSYKHGQGSTREVGTQDPLAS